ncbi:MAG: toll/interleukin-1 receptor domain-containing protein [Pseudomonadota bacterium]
MGTTEKPFPAYQGDQPYLFVCYAHEDATIVYDEMLWLHETGVRLWYDDGVRVGTVWRRVLAEALEGARGLVFMQTQQSVQSEFCMNEIRFALDEEKPVFVVTLEDSRLPAELRLSLGDRQAMVKDNFAVGDFRRRLADALKACLGISDDTEAPGAEGSGPSSSWIRRRRRQRNRRLFTTTVCFIDTQSQDKTGPIADDIAAEGGEVLSREGTLLVAAFDSAATAMELLTRRPRGWRVGISSGDLLFEDGLFHGTPMAEAASLKDSAEPGQVWATNAFVRLLDSTPDLDHQKDMGIDFEATGEGVLLTTRVPG